MASSEMITRIQSSPRTHKCVTVWANGMETRVDAVSESAAENHATIMRRAVVNGEAVSVTVSEI